MGFISQTKDALSDRNFFIFILSVIVLISSIVAYQFIVTTKSDMLSEKAQNDRQQIITKLNELQSNEDAGHNITIIVPTNDTHVTGKISSLELEKPLVINLTK